MTKEESMAETSRRSAMKTALKAAMYAAPVIVSASTVRAVAAATPPGPIVTVNPPSGPGGLIYTLFTFTGAGFPPGTQLFFRVFQDNHGIIVNRNPVISDTQGGISGSINPTFGFIAGSYTFSVEQTPDGLPIASANFTVT